MAEIEHTVRAIRSELLSVDRKVLVKFIDQPNPLRVCGVTSQYGAVKVKVLNDSRWKFLDDRDAIYSVRDGVGNDYL